MMDFTPHTNGTNGNGTAGGTDAFVISSLSDDIRRYAGLLWHWAWLLILLTILAGVTAYVVSSRQTPIYQASTTLYINEAPGARSNAYADLLTSERLASTYAELITKRPVLDQVIAELALGVEADWLGRRVTVAQVEGTQLIEIVVAYPADPQLAADIANKIGEVFTSQTLELQSSRYAESKDSLAAQLQSIDGQIEQAQADVAALGEPEEGENNPERDRLVTNLALYQQIYASVLQSLEIVRLSEIESTSNLIQVENAIVPGFDEFTSPNVFQDTMLAAIVGLMLAIGIVFLIEVLDDTVKGPVDVNRHLGLPILGFVSHFKPKETGPITAIQPRSPLSEAFRSLRTNIQFASVDKPIKTLLVTSPSPQDGKSTVATNIAVVIAQSGRPVSLIDCDLRRPSQHKRLRISNRTGLSDLFVQEKIFLDGALKQTGVPGLHFIGSGGLPPNPSELIGSEKMMEIFRQIRKKTEMIVVDSPPIMAVTDATVLASRVDGVLVVIRPGKTKLAHAKHTVDQLRRSGANILGIVLNDVERRRSRYYYYYKGYYAYDYYYGDNGGKKKKRRNGRKEKTRS